MMLSHSGEPCDFTSMMSVKEVTGKAKLGPGQDDVEVMVKTLCRESKNSSRTIHPCTQTRVFLAVYFGQRNEN